MRRHREKGGGDWRRRQEGTRGGDGEKGVGGRRKQETGGGQRH